jgi:hypothetical protein
MDDHQLSNNITKLIEKNETRIPVIIYGYSTTNTVPCLIYVTYKWEHYHGKFNISVWNNYFYFEYFILKN